MRGERVEAGAESEEGGGRRKPQSTRRKEREKRRKINELVTVAFANWAVRVCECHTHTSADTQEATAADAAGRRQALMI